MDEKRLPTTTLREIRHNIRVNERYILKEFDPVKQFDLISAKFRICDILSPQDIQTLYDCARNIKMTHVQKYKVMDELMERKGFKKFGVGTNRRIYEIPGDTHHLIKIAIDRVALTDSLREYFNQKLFKPLVSKIFEVTPCGTVALCEKVIPIKYPEEICSYGEQYIQLTEIIFGRYIMDDISIKSYMNYGVREGFGLVLLDYPYLYEVKDYNKLFCDRCGAPISFSYEFSKLQCEHCGKTFLTRDVAEVVDPFDVKNQNSIGEINTREGVHNMKVFVRRGKETLFTKNTCDYTKTLRTDVRKVERPKTKVWVTRGKSTFEEAWDKSELEKAAKLDPKATEDNTKKVEEKVKAKEKITINEATTETEEIDVNAKPVDLPEEVKNKFIEDESPVNDDIKVEDDIIAKYEEEYGDDDVQNFEKIKKNNIYKQY